MEAGFVETQGDFLLLLFVFFLFLFYNPLKLHGGFLLWLTPELLMKTRTQQSCLETHKPNISLEGVNIYPGRRRCLV